MKILFVCRTQGWMGTYIHQVAKGFQLLGHRIIFMDYHFMAKSNWLANLIRYKKRYSIERKTSALTKLIKDIKPDMVIFALAHLLFDFSQIRKIYPGILIFFDMDGPALPCYKSGFDWIREFDLLASVSKLTVRQLNSLGYDNIMYWPHGVDPLYFRPLQLSKREIQEFGSKMAFVGRPTKRRANMLKELPIDSLAIWGHRWWKRPYKNDPVISKALRSKSDILGLHLVKMYNASNVILNILRETFAEHHTIMNLQVFSVPACGTCLLTEWVEEIEEAFDLDKEILVFKNSSEFVEKAIKYSKDQELARKIGKAGRLRCLREHTHKHRAQQLLKKLGFPSSC